MHYWKTTTIIILYCISSIFSGVKSVNRTYWSETPEQWPSQQQSEESLYTLNCIYRSHLFATSMRSFLPTLKRRSLYLCLSSSEIPLINTVDPLLPGETGASTCMNENNHLDWSYPHELLCSCSLSLCRDVLTWKYTGAGKVWTELLCSSKKESLGNENRDS